MYGSVENIRLSGGSKRRYSNAFWRIGVVGLVIFGVLTPSLFLICNLTKNAYDNTQFLEEVSEFSMPEEMRGVCNASCVPNEAFPCGYTPTYPVQFTQNGQWFWRAPFEDLPGAEIGFGLMLTASKEHQNMPGYWKASFYGGNRYKPDPNEVTHCACYYVTGGPTTDKFLLHNYRVHEIPHKFSIPIQDVCLEDFKGCPDTEEQALLLYGSPWIESYDGCDRHKNTLD